VFIPVLMKKFALTLIVIAVLAPAAQAKRRAVHHPAEACSYSVSPTWTGSISSAGVTRAAVLVFGQQQTPACVRWGAYTSASWITIEAAPLDAQPVAYVTVAPNTDISASRTANIVVAGIRLQVTQDSAARISPPTTDSNLIPNGKFDTGILPWGWPAHFPNATGGVAQWSQFDANGSPASGSLFLRDNDGGLAYQQQQCIRVTKSTNYRYGAKVRALAGREVGEGIMAVFLYPTADCSGDFTGQFISVLRPSEPGVWQEFTFDMRSGSRTQAVIVVIASAADVPPFEMWFDDVFLRP
jgi:Putative binding domain, N-terminal